MRILISGICGFAGNAIARGLVGLGGGYEVEGFDNFIRPGSELNRAELKRLGVKLFHADVRAASDVDSLPPADWVIDAAANPSVLAGVDGLSSSRQVIEHNLGGTVNLLEYCKRNAAGITILSTSRVYSIAPLAALASAWMSFTPRRFSSARLSSLPGLMKLSKPSTSYPPPSPTSPRAIAFPAKPQMPEMRMRTPWVFGGYYCCGGWAAAFALASW